MHYIIFDIETTCWETEYPVRRRELIELGAVALDEYGHEISRYEQLVRPEQHPHLSPYCIRLTGIQQVQLDEAATFTSCYNDFIHWQNSIEDELTFIAWGKFDRIILEDCCRWHGLETMLPFPYLDAKYAYHDMKKLSKKLGLLKVMKREGLDFIGDHHRALPDALNLARLFRLYVGEWPI